MAELSEAELAGLRLVTATSTCRKVLAGAEEGDAQVRIVLAAD